MNSPCRGPAELHLTPPEPSQHPPSHLLPKPSHRDVQELALGFHPIWFSVFSACFFSPQPPLPSVFGSFLFSFFRLRSLLQFQVYLLLLCTPQPPSSSPTSVFCVTCPGAEKQSEQEPVRTVSKSLSQCFMLFLKSTFSLDLDSF